jgi:uncharacterized protein (DUF927 family)
MNKPTYTVAICECIDDGIDELYLTCGHAHRTVEAAVRCGNKLYAAKTMWYVRRGYEHHVINSHAEYLAQIERERLAWNVAARRLTTHPY